MFFVRLRYSGRIARGCSYALKKTVASMVMQLKKAFDSKGDMKSATCRSGLDPSVEVRKLGHSSNAFSKKSNSAVRLAARTGRGQVNRRGGQLNRSRLRKSMHAKGRLGEIGTSKWYEHADARKNGSQAQLFNHLLFLVEKICSFDSVDDARQCGYEFIIPDTAIAEESEIADLELDENYRWSIPTTDTDGNSVSNIDNKNLAAFSKLYKDFPELTITLEYV